MQKPMMAAQTPPKLGQLGPYRLIAKIGEGGMGTVHLARMDGPAGCNKLAVVKELRAELAGSSEFREMFSNEVRLATRLTHPNVVHTYGANEDHGRLYLAMEYLDGQPWSRIRNALWSRGSLPNGLHLKVLAEALSGLHYAHELHDYDGTPLQVVHCDVSPQNVFVTYDGLVKLVDFGVARAVNGKPRATSGVVMGKLAYIAPEQARGDAIDRRADLFAMGVMLWEAMTGRRFVQNEDPAEARRRRIFGMEPRVRTIAPDSPPALAEICDRALALDPAERFATAAEFREALLGVLAEEVLDADRIKLGELVVGAFQKERARVHALIEQHMRPTTSTSSVDHLVVLLQPEAPIDRTQPADMTELASVSRRIDDLAVIDPPQPSVSFRPLRRKPSLPLTMFGVALASFTITWIVSRPEPQPKSHVSSTSAIRAVEPSVAASRETQPPPNDGEPQRRGEPRYNLPLRPSLPETTLHAATDPIESGRTAVTLLQLTISARPARARLYLDGVALSDNPFSARVRADHRLHTVRASGSGLVTQERTITFDRDHAISLVLNRVRPARAASVRGPNRKLPATGASVGSAATTSAAGRGVDSNGAGRPRPRARISDFYDAPLRVGIGKPQRPIYEDDPYRQE